jgi:hypothetical protein
MSKEVYVSTDIESDGPCPGKNNMLSFASAALTIDKELVGTYWSNLELLDWCKPDPDTMNNFWAKEPEAWAACRHSLRSAEYAMPEYARWTRGFNRKPVFVAYPAGFDFMYMAYYLHMFAGENPFGFQALDVKSYFMAQNKIDGFKASVKKRMPGRWFERDMVHNHVALADAIEQGCLFINMHRENLGLEPVPFTNKTGTPLEQLISSAAGK